MWEFVVDKVALGQVLLQVLQFSPANIIPPLLHITASVVSSHVVFVVDKVAVGQALGFPLPVSFHHCSIFICHRRIRCAIAPTKQHIITTLVLS
jgi:hypothetical protein